MFFFFNKHLKKKKKRLYFSKPINNKKKLTSELLQRRKNTACKYVITNLQLKSENNFSFKFDIQILIITKHSNWIMKKRKITKHTLSRKRKSSHCYHPICCFYNSFNQFFQAFSDVILHFIELEILTLFHAYSHQMSRVTFIENEPCELVKILNEAI